MLPGTQHKQFVTIAALTESNSGITMNMSSATPIVCNDSIRNMKRKCERCGFFHDLKKQIRQARMNAPISGTENAISNAHIHATRSSSGIMETNDLSRPCLHNETYTIFHNIQYASNDVGFDKFQTIFSMRFSTYQIFIAIR